MHPPLNFEIWQTMHVWGMRATSHIRLKAQDHRILRSIIGRKDWDIQVHFTLESEDPRAQKQYPGRRKPTWTPPTWQTINNVSQSTIISCVRPTSKQQDSTQIPADHVNGRIFERGSSAMTRFHARGGSWSLCDEAAVPKYHHAL